MSDITPLERDLMIFQDPNLLDKICKHVSSGGSVLSLAEIWGINFGVLMGWIRGDKDREGKYELALKDRKEWALERVLSELQSIGTATPDESIRTSDKIKALELIGKNLAAWTDRVEETKTIKLSDIILSSYEKKKE